MKHVYAVINPSTKVVVGYAKINQKVDSETTVPSFVIDTVSGDRKDILSLVLVDHTHPEFEYSESLFSLLDVKSESQYGFTLDGEDHIILTDNSILKKLKKEVDDLHAPEHVKSLLTKLSKAKDNFIFKTFKHKPVDKVKVGDVLVSEEKLVHVLDVKDDQTLEVSTIKEDLTHEEPQILETKEVFRVGRF